MNLYLGLLMCVNIVIILAEKHYCDSLGVLLYDEIGCKPVFSSNQTCPTSYKCPKREISEGYCTYNGIKVKNQERLVPGFGGCLMGCFCDATNNKDRPFICAMPGCLGYHSETCYNVEELGGCCPVEAMCAPFDNVAKCVVDGVTYTEGKRFNPKNTCWDCVCKSGFRGIYEEPHCIRKQCSVEFYNYGELDGECVPVYENGTALCCPNGFICPNNVISLNKNNNAVTAETNGSCSFGGVLYRSNETLSIKYKPNYFEKKANCSCILPPLLTCINDA